MEFSAKLPGDPTTGGLWPALWMLGNLARGTYVGSSDFVWPYSYNACSKETRNSQLITACDKVEHFGMKSFRGRGSPEIDILEAMMGEPGPLPNTPIERPYFSTSLQVAPGIKENRPLLGHQPKKDHWYKGLEYGKAVNASLNPFFYGVTLVHEPKSYTYQSDAISANTHIGKSYFDEQHIYRVEWEPPETDGSGGYLRWYLDGAFVYGIKGDSLSLTGTEIPSEPMYLLMNTAVATTWGFPLPCPDGCDCDCFECGNPDCVCGFPEDFCENVPANFEIDYVRVYQAVNETKHVLGCSTEDRPTADFIIGNKDKFMEDGDKVPLKRIRVGGGPCKKDSHCGGPNRGTCDRYGVCECTGDFTGPQCLAHAGFYDDPYLRKQVALSYNPPMVPTGLAIILILLGVGFVIIVSFFFVQRRRDEGYSPVSQGPPPPKAGGTYGTAGALGGTRPNEGDSGSYQNTVNSQTSLSQQSKNKVTKYCMIDGRLVDN